MASLSSTAVTDAPPTHHEGIHLLHCSLQAEAHAGQPFTMAW
jgi:hypothetical protein